MRLNEFETATKYFRQAHRINSKKPHLRMAMMILRQSVTKGGWRKRRREARLDDDVKQASKKVCRQKMIPQEYSRNESLRSNPAA